MRFLSIVVTEVVFAVALRTLRKPRQINLLTDQSQASKGILFNGTNTAREGEMEKSKHSHFNASTTSRLPLKFTRQCRFYDRPCHICEGDCEADVDCAEGLACFFRDSGTPSQQIPVPGCNTGVRERFLLQCIFVTMCGLG